VSVGVPSGGRPSPRFADLEVGQELTPLVRGPVTSVHLVRWAAAVENWHRIHYDEPFATRHDGLPGLLINGSWKQHVLVQMLRRWAGPEGWVLRAGFQFRSMDVVGSTLTAWGRVTGLEQRGDLGLVGCEIGIRNQDGVESTPGTATVLLPARSGAHVPYPLPVDLADTT
jgi:acyl dehydratase